jgi:hypothetical protein
MGLSEASWIAITCVVLTAVLGGVGVVLSGLLSALVYLVKQFFDYAKTQLAQLPEIKQELVEQRYARQGDRKDIDRAHQRLDGHETRIIRVEGCIDTEAE